MSNIKNNTNFRFLLIYPLTVGEIPRALSMLAGVLRKHGFEVKTAVNTFKKPLNVSDYVRIAKEWRATHVGLSMYTLQVLKSYEIMKAIKEELGIPIILGGAHPSSEPVEGINWGADIIVRGEGEDTLRELCEYWKGELVQPSNVDMTMLTEENMNKANETFASKRVNETRASKALEQPLSDIASINDLSKIKSITYRDQKTGEIISTPPRALLSELDDLPTPAHDIFDDDAFRVNNVVRGHHRLYTTRGCPGRCTYCNSGVFGNKIRCYSVETIMERIREVYNEHGITNFNIADDNFTTKKKHVYGMCEAIKKEFPQIVWSVNSRVDMVNPEMLAAMKDSGCYMISYGIESGDQETLDKLRKHVKVKRNYDAIWQTHEAGIQVFANMLVGLPWETPKNIQNGIDFFHSVKDAVHLWQLSGAIIPLPGTAMYYDLGEENNFQEYWLNPDFHMQAAGIQVWQNSTNPYALSTYFQRNMFDDNFIATGKFFKYSDEHQRSLKELMFLYGGHNLTKLYGGQRWKQFKIKMLSHLSYFIYHHVDPEIEMNVVNQWVSRKNKDAEKSSRWGRSGLRERVAKKENKGLPSHSDDKYLVNMPSHMKPRNTQ
jgi:magnesium-protoporphyrin IX monomethyl ester (oxidative) cyclase|tara:strand:+ start:323 stop:2134 length:1812 start_codon:yes stop_codon:yes gene_type:complete